MKWNWSSAKTNIYHSACQYIVDDLLKNVILTGLWEIEGRTRQTCSSEALTVSFGVQLLATDFIKETQEYLWNQKLCP